MKECSLKINCEQGFFLPFVLFIAIVLFSAITTTIAIYKNELNISNQLQEQMKSETIVQMAMYKFKKDKPFNESTSGTITYSFPPGNVTINYTMLDMNKFNLVLLIETDTFESFTITKHLEIEQNE